MNEEQTRGNLEQTLYDFIKRVSEGKTTSETEVQVLPEVAKVLKDLIFGY